MAMKKLLLIFAMLVFVSSSLAQDGNSEAFEKRAQSLPVLLNEANDLENSFSSGFLSQVPATQLAETFKQLRDAYGNAERVSKVEKEGKYTGLVSVEFDKGFELIFRMVVAGDGKNLIEGLLVTSVQKSSNSLVELIAEIDKLEGKKSFLAAKLGKESITNLHELNPAQSMATGSTFKLYVLAELAKEIRAGNRNWSDTVELSEKSLPTGLMQNWIPGSPASLNTLATLMISISDNTATDQLIDTLGRENIETLLEQSGNVDSERSIPLLKTSEAFKLKGLEDSKYGKEYIEADLAGKRKMLADLLPTLDIDDINLASFLKKPTYIEEIEWFASCIDLANLLNELRMEEGDAESSMTLKIMSVNKGLDKKTAAKYGYVGYKGGSEPGVISMTYLLQSKAGDWYVVSGSHNNKEKAVNDSQFIGIMQRAVSLFAEEVSN